MYQEVDIKATEAEAVREFAENVGRDNPQQAWILSNYDTWESNPFYRGEPVPHPEEEEADYHAEQERLSLQNSSGVDMVSLSPVTSWFTFNYEFKDHCEANGCLTLIEEVPF